MEQVTTFINQRFKNVHECVKFMNALLMVIILTFLPTLELRASIPYGILATDLPLFVVVLVAIVVNILLGPLVFLLLDTVVTFMRKFAWFEKLFARIVERPRKKISKAVDRWGELGIALFIGIPLPGSGVYTAALGAYLLGLDKKKFFIATIIGVVIAAVAVTIITLTGSSLFEWMIKR